MKTFAGLLCVITIITGCGREGGGMVSASKTQPTTTAEGRSESVLKSGARSDFQVTSEAFALGKTIPPKYTGEGEDLSPPLVWGGAPEGTRAFAVIVSDPDAQPAGKLTAPAGAWFHWVLYNVPGDVTMLPEGLPREAVLSVPASARQGHNSWPTDNVGYRGPQPPRGSGPHRYYFSVYALDGPLDLDPAAATAETLQAAMADHVLAEAQTMGTYLRK
jgi:Raf kinase inhibitor-like YbhB/YbcL family protein